MHAACSAWIADVIAPPRVTVGISFFDEEKHLADAVRSILLQTFEDFELLLLDDGSTDASLSVARSFDDPRISVISDGRRRHLPARLNEIVRRARGTFVARMDADDVAHPRRLETQLALLDRDRCDVVGTWAGLVDEAGKLLGIVESAELPPDPSAVIERGLLVHASVVGRRAWFLARPYDEALTRAEDRDLWCRSVDDSSFGVVREPLYVIRVSSRDERFLSDYVDAQRQNRTIFVRHGPGRIGWSRTAKLWAASYAKEAVMRVAVRSHAASRLVARRGREATDAEQDRVREALDA